MHKLVLESKFHWYRIINVDLRYTYTAAIEKDLIVTNNKIINGKEQVVNCHDRVIIERALLKKYRLTGAIYLHSIATKKDKAVVFLPYSLVNFVDTNRILPLAISSNKYKFPSLTC